MDYKIRKVTLDDLQAVVKVEQACFPVQEAAGTEALRSRIETFPESFLVAVVQARGGEQVIGMINGAVTSRQTICDPMFEDVSLHEPDGAYQSIFGLDVAKEFRCQGVAAALMKAMIRRARAAGRKGLILTCKHHLIAYYERFGFQNLGVSKSEHGNAVWFDMVMELDEDGPTGTDI